MFREDISSHQQIHELIFPRIQRYHFIKSQVVQKPLYVDTLFVFLHQHQNVKKGLIVVKPIFFCSGFEFKWKQKFFFWLFGVGGGLQFGENYPVQFSFQPQIGIPYHRFSFNDFYQRYFLIHIRIFIRRFIIYILNIIHGKLYHIDDAIVNFLQKFLLGDFEDIKMIEII